jgi:hypothetical protein
MSIRSPFRVDNGNTTSSFELDIMFFESVAKPWFLRSRESDMKTEDGIDGEIR